MSKILKIKDNVDLKELEKFGFKRERFCNSINEFFYYEKEATKRRTVYYEIYENYRIINIVAGDDLFPVPLDNTIYNLTQAGLIEEITKQED